MLWHIYLYLYVEIEIEMREKGGQSVRDRERQRGGERERERERKRERENKKEHRSDYIYFPFTGNTGTRGTCQVTSWTSRTGSRDKGYRKYTPPVTYFLQLGPTSYCSPPSNTAIIL
jgi:hypothetical protein